MFKDNRVFKEFFDTLEEPAFLINSDYRVLYANTAFLALAQRKKSSVIDSFCYELMDPRGKPCSVCPVQKALKKGKIASVIRSKSGRHIEVKGIRIAKNIAVEVIRDISEPTVPKVHTGKTAIVNALEHLMVEFSSAQTPNEALTNACNYIIKELNYSMVKVSYLERDGSHRLICSIGTDKEGALSVSLPLILRGQVIGVMDIYATDSKAFSASQMELLRNVSFYAAMATEKILAAESVKNSQIEWQQTFDAIGDPIFIHDENYRLLRANRAYQQAAGIPFKEMLGKPYFEIFPKQDSPLPVCSHIVDGRQKGKGSEEFVTSDGRAYLCDSFPININSGTTRFVHVLKEITSLVNAKESLKDEARTTQSLLEFSSSIGRLLDFGAIFEEASKTLINLIGAERTVVFLDDEGLNAVVFHGWPEHLVPLISTLKLRQGEMQAVDMLFRGEDIITDNATRCEFFSKNFSEQFGLRAVAMIPLMTSDQTIGAILAERANGFSAKERQILRGIAANTGIAAENARLYKESIEMAADLARRIETIRTTHAIDRAILSSLNREEILEVAAKNTQRIVPADKVCIAIADEKEGKHFYKSEAFSFGSSPLLDSVIKTGRVVSIPDLASYKHPDPVVSGLLKGGFCSLIALPLFTRGKRFGSIIMSSKRIAAFDKEDIENGEKLTAQIAIALENAKLYEDIKDLFISTVTALVNAVDAKSPWTRGHSERVTEYALLIGKQLGLSNERMENLRLAGLLHDIGKISTCETVLDKPDKLTESEFELVKAHPGRGVEIISPIKQLADIIPIIRGHHERIDGTGYPDGLSGNDIPLEARILCVADAYDSMTADRPYRPAPGREFAIKELKRCSGTQFDPEVVEAFLKALKSQEA